MKLDGKNEQHLGEEQLIRAVVDATDLSPSAQAHLATCGQCLADKDSFELEMTKLGQKAERFVPKPQGRIILPAAKTKNLFGNFLQWRSWAAAASAAAAVFILVWGTNIVRNLSESGSKDLTAEIAAAERLMTEVNTLVDNALPPFYVEISGEKNANYDEEFYQFLIPTLEDKALTSVRGQKGTSLC